MAFVEGSSIQQRERGDRTSKRLAQAFQSKPKQGRADPLSGRVTPNEQLLDFRRPDFEEAEDFLAA